MSHDPTDPLPYARMQVAPPPRRPAVVTVLAIIAIVVYSMLLLCSPLALVPADPDDALDKAFTGSGAMRIYTIVSSLVYMAIAVLAIIAASYCLALRAWARRMLVRVAIADLLLTGIGLVVLFAFTLPEAMNSATDPSVRSMVQVTMIVVTAVSLVLPVLPICLIYFLTRRRVVDAFEQSSTPAGGRGYDAADV